MTHRDEIERIAHYAVELLAQQEFQGKAVREPTKYRLGALLDAHMLALGAVASAIGRMAGQRLKIVEHSQRQIVLIASFIQGINLSETAISEGYYLQAAALIRQEMETIAALEELKKGIRQDSRTPNVSNVPWGLGRLYGDLSKAAHAADHGFLQGLLLPKGVELPAETTAVTMVQTPDPELAWRLYGLHVALLLLLAVHVNDHSELVGTEGLVKSEVQAISTAQQILIDEGWFLEG